MYTKKVQCFSCILNLVWLQDQDIWLLLMNRIDGMKSVVKFDRISISIDVSFVRMISHFPLFLPTLQDLVANIMHRLWNCMVEFRPTGMSFIYYTYINGPKTYPWNTPDSIGTLILSPSIITLHPISYHFFIYHMS